MKKIISLILAFSVILSCFFSVNVFAAEEESSALEDILNDVTNMEGFENSIVTGSSGFIYPDNADYDVDQMIANGEIEGEMLGITVDYLYNDTSALYWSSLDVSKDDLSLAKANINSYLQRILKNKYGGFNLFSMSTNEDGVPFASQYATDIANFLGNLFYPDFENVTISFEGTETISSDEFYGAIVEKSGFGNLLQYNWCNQGSVDFRPLIEIWGLSCENVLKSEFYDGYRLGKKLVAAVINKFLSEGPVNALLDIIKVYSRSYSAYLYDATVGLFNLKISAGIIDREELRNFHGLFNLIFNNNNPSDTTKLQFVQMPTNRFKVAADTTELFLYLLVYFNINAQYKENEKVINSYKSELTSTDLSDEEQTVIKSMIDGILKGDLKEFVKYLTDLFSYNLSETPNDLLSALTNALASFFKKISDYFDNLLKMLTGEKEFPRWD